MHRSFLPALLGATVAVAACATARPTTNTTNTTVATSTGATPLVIGETFTMPARAIGGELRRINVWLPPEYAASPTVRLPVLYMPDGGMAEDFQHVAGLLQVSIGNGTMRPMILVGIENTQRRRDMTGPTTVAKDSTIARQVGGSAAFRAFFRDELMPEVARRYRTTNERAIVGESLAGLFVVETFMLEPRMFDAYFAFDPSIWWNDVQMVRESGTRLRARPAGTQSLWIASSDEPGMIVQVGQLVDTLRSVAPPGLTWHWEPMPTETHGTIYHPAALRAFRAMLAPRPDSTKR